MRRRRPSGSGTLRVAHITTVDLSLWILLRAQLGRLRDEGYEVTAISAPGPYVPALEADGIRHIAWRGATRGWSLASDVRAFFELFRILRRERFDLVHTHNPKPGVLGRIAARLAGVPVVVNTEHGLYATPDDPLLRKASVLTLEWIAARFSDLELYQSEEDFAWAQKLRLARPPRGVLLGNGVDLSRFDRAHVPDARARALRAELGIAPDAVVVGTVGRLVAEKGYRELFAASAEIRASYPEAVVLVVGGPDGEKWDSLTADEIATARRDVIFAGHREDVSDLLAVMDVFVLASWREGLPRSAIEGAAMGLPLVLTNIRGCREVVRDGVEGMLVPVRSPAALAQAISRLLADPALRRRMGEAARDRALDRFNEETVVSKVVAEYERMLGPAPRRATTETGIRIRPATRADAASLARYHRETIPTAFLPILGDRFLRLLYRSLATDPEGVALILEDEHGSPAGFVTGVASTRRFYRRFFVRHALHAGALVGPKLLRPSVLRRVLQTARYPAGTDGLPDAELFSFGVDAGLRAKGFGRSLVERFVRDIGGRGARDVKIVVFAENVPANRVLERLGWSVARVISIHDGRPSNIWVTSTRPSERPLETTDAQLIEEIAT